MEQSHIFLSLLFLIPFMYLYLFKRNSGRSEVKLPPGSAGFPLIGESLSYYWKIRKGCHYEFVKERMDKFSSKVFRTSLMGENVAMLCGAEGNKFLFTNEFKLVKVWWPSLLDKLFPRSDTNEQPTSDLAYMVNKTILSHFLKPDALRQYVGVIDAVMKQHMETYWTGRDEVKVGGMAKKYTLALACNFFLGINDLNQVDEIAEGMKEIESATTAVRINLPGTAWNHGMKASEIVRSKILAIIRQRKEELSKQSSNSTPVMKDFISHMLSAVDENAKLFKEGDIASLLGGMLLAAYTSLHTIITMLMKNLADLPDAYDSVLKEQTEIALSKEPGDTLSWEDMRKMKYSWNAMREILRLYVPGLGFKEVLSDFTYAGYKIPKGWKIYWIAHATHRDPKYFENPDNFDPSRFDGNGPAPYTFIPFGGGIRMCPGNEYARLAILTFVHYAMTEFKWEKLISDEIILHFPLPRPAQGLPIRLYPRK